MYTYLATSNWLSPETMPWFQSPTAAGSGRFGVGLKKPVPLHVLCEGLDLALPDQFVVCRSHVHMYIPFGATGAVVLDSPLHALMQFGCHLCNTGSN